MLTKQKLYKFSQLSNDNTGDKKGELQMMKKISLLLLTLVLLITSVAAVAAMPINIDRVEINDIELEQNAANRLDVIRDNEFEIEISFTPTQNVDNVEIEAAIYGFEYNDISRIADYIGNADYDANVTYVRKLRLTLPDEVDEDDYRLRIIFADRNNGEIVQNYNLKIDVPRHKLKIEDIIIFPSNDIEAGRALLATVRIENKGEKTEDDVRIEISIPELGLAAVDYIEEIDPDDEEETEEIFLAIPVCTKAGQYIIDINVEFDQLKDNERAQVPIRIIESDRCSDNQEQDTEPVVVVQQVQPQEPVEPVADEQPTTSTKNVVRKVLEVLLLVLIGILVIIGLIIGFSKLGRTQDF